MSTGKLTIFTGKMGAGKSTLSISIADRTNAVLISEDAWLDALFPGQISCLNDYVEYSARLKPQIKQLAQSILLCGTDVVMDFPANTVSQRDWLRSVFDEIDAPHELIYLDVPNADCLKRIEKRRLEQPERAKTDTVEMFEAVTRHFVEPSAMEGFNIIVRKVDA